MLAHKRRKISLRIVKSFSILLLIAANVLIIAPVPAFACSCVESGPPGQELATSTAVFAGRVIDIEAPIGLVIYGAQAVKVTIQVSEVWKGPVQHILVVTTERSGASCGYEFASGQEYLVYARGVASNLETGLCSRTRPLAAAAEDLTALGAGSIPAADSPDAVVRPSFALPVILLLGGVGIGIGLVIVVVMATRRGRPPRQE